MKNRFIRSNGCIIVFVTAAFLPVLVSRKASAQTVRASTPELNRRLENEKNLRDNERLRRGMEADTETRARTKEERQSLANEAFMRLQVLHNDIMTMILSSDVPDFRRVTDSVAETKKRAIELRENLILPKPTKDEKKGKDNGAVGGDDLKESLSRLCAHIKSFVISLNNSPSDTKAGEQAGRELESLISLSEKISADLVKAEKRGN